MNNFYIFGLLLSIGSLAMATDAVVSVQIISRDKVVTSTLLDVGPCYTDTNADTHKMDYKISFPITTRETGQTWLESRGEIVPGSLATFDRLVTKDYSRGILHNKSVFGTSHEDRHEVCDEIQKSFVRNKELAEKLFKPVSNQ